MTSDDPRLDVAEVFVSPQGEGRYTGALYTFVRLAGCNLRCRRDGDAGFDCDTDFVSARSLTHVGLLNLIEGVERTAAGGASTSDHPLCFTGGEPTMQLGSPRHAEFLRSLAATRSLRLETNGTMPLDDPAVFDWIACSPKSAWHTLRIQRADEVRYVRRVGGFLPSAEQVRERFPTAQLYVSPAFGADGKLDPENLKWCEMLVRQSPEYALSVQTHKLIGVP